MISIAMPAWTITPSPRSYISSSVYCCCAAGWKPFWRAGEIGGLLCEFAKHHPKDRWLFECIRGSHRSGFKLRRWQAPHAAMGALDAV